MAWQKAKVKQTIQPFCSTPRRWYVCYIDEHYVPSLLVYKEVWTLQAASCIWYHLCLNPNPALTSGVHVHHSVVHDVPWPQKFGHAAASFVQLQLPVTAWADPPEND